MAINHYKQLSFPNYLKKLRIDYALIQLSTNVSLLKYNYQGLAEIFGFKTSESFSRAFYSQTGVYPSNIIKEFKKKIKQDHL
jgi:AraC-like DNA-binding protein